MATKILYAVPMAHEATLPVLERLRAEGCELTFNRTGRTLTEDELIALLPGVFGTIAGGEAYTERVFAAAAPELKVVARMGVDQKGVAHKVTFRCVPIDDRAAVHPHYVAAISDQEDSALDFCLVDGVSGLRAHCAPRLPAEAQDRRHRDRRQRQLVLAARTQVLGTELARPRRRLPDLRMGRVRPSGRRLALHLDQQRRHQHRDLDEAWLTPVSHELAAQFCATAIIDFASAGIRPTRLKRRALKPA